jgi:hypothetical protein
VAAALVLVRANSSTNSVSVIADSCAAPAVAAAQPLRRASPFFSSGVGCLLACREPARGVRTSGSQQ